MLQSMTGFGSNSLQIDELEVYVEIKTLNSRYFDSKISIPSTLSSQELIINNVLKEKLKRGKVDLRIKFMGSSNDSVSFNKSVIKNYINDLKEISDFDDSHILKSVLSLPNSISKGELSFSDVQTKKIIDQIIIFGDAIMFLESYVSKDQNCITRAQLAQRRFHRRPAPQFCRHLCKRKGKIRQKHTAKVTGVSGFFTL